MEEKLLGCGVTLSTCFLLRKKAHPSLALWVRKNDCDLIGKSLIQFSGLCPSCHCWSSC